MSDTAKVRANASITINLGNYESARVEAGIELPCLPNNTQETFKKAWAEVERELQIKASEIRNRK